MGRHITKDVWDKLRLARAAGASFAELSRQSGINRNTILSYAARHGWSHQIATARQQADSGKPDVTDIVQRVLAEKGRAAKLHIADILLQVLAEAKKRGIVIEDASDLETANQKPTSQAGSLAVGFVFMLIPQAAQHRYFTKREISFGNHGQVVGSGTFGLQ